MSSIHLHGVHEIALSAQADAANPTWDEDVLATCVAPSGRELTVRGFWDGGRTWRVRFSPDETGTWRWRTQAKDPGLRAAGAVTCVPYTGDNPLYHHGPIRVSASRTFLEHADGTPFFWLGDTAWNGVIRGADANWERFLTLRAAQRFTVVQFVCCHWRGDARDEHGDQACTEAVPIRIVPAFFQRLDRRVARINAHGLVGAPVALWALLESDIGRKLPEADAIRLATYIIARYDAYQVAWLLGGDGNYQLMGVDRWQRIGRAVFATGHDRLASLHPCGLNWVGEEFRGEAWYDFIGYQSGHGDSDKDLHWLTAGPPATCWRRTPRLPVINLEPNYETAIGYHQRTVFTDYHVRRAAYWSLLLSPTAGLTYGHDAIWNWNLASGPSEGHGNWHDGAVPPWSEGLETPGIAAMTVLRHILDCLPWTTLVPAPDALRQASGDPPAFVASARAADGTLVVYAPRGGDIPFAAAPPAPLRLIEPRTGAVRLLEGPFCPDGQDWLLVCGPGWLHQSQAMRP